MNRRVLLLLLLLIVIGGGAVLFLVTQPQPGTQPPGTDTGIVGPTQVINTPTAIRVTPILIAVQALPRGIRIPEGAVDIRYFPAESVPTYSIGADPQNAEDRARALQQVIGKIARSDISVEQPILSTMLVDDVTQAARIGSDASAVIPVGLQAISVPIDRNSAVSFAPRPGDYVDVIVSFLYVDVDEEFQSRRPNLLSFTTIKSDGSVEIVQALNGRLEPSSLSQFPVVVGPSETQRPRLITQRSIQSALVINMGNFPLDGFFIGNTPTPLVPPTVPADSGEATKGPPTAVPTKPFPETITIAVRPQEAIVLAWLMEARVPLTFTLRSPDDRDRANVPSTPVTLRYIVETYQLAPPPRLPYALEPAIRSIRQLVSGTLTPIDGGGVRTTTGGGQ
jgi:Flp pilus assembly protein CpaB